MYKGNRNRNVLLIVQGEYRSIKLELPVDLKCFARLAVDSGPGSPVHGYPALYTSRSWLRYILMFLFTESLPSTDPDLGYGKPGVYIKGSVLIYLPSTNQDYVNGSYALIAILYTSRSWHLPGAYILGEILYPETCSPLLKVIFRTKWKNM